MEDKVKKCKYESVRAFVADLNCILNNSKCGSSDLIWREQAEYLKSKSQRMREICS